MLLLLFPSEDFPLPLQYVAETNSHIVDCVGGMKSEEKRIKQKKRIKIGLEREERLQLRRNGWDESLRKLQRNGTIAIAVKGG